MLIISTFFLDDILVVILKPLHDPHAVFFSKKTHGAPPHCVFLLVLLIAE
jgi:hypothetical protein